MHLDHYLLEVSLNSDGFVVKIKYYHIYQRVQQHSFRVDHPFLIGLIQNGL